MSERCKPPLPLMNGYKLVKLSGGSNGFSIQNFNNEVLIKDYLEKLLIKLQILDLENFRNDTSGITLNSRQKMTLQRYLCVEISESIDVLTDGENLSEEFIKSLVDTELGAISRCLISHIILKASESLVYRKSQQRFTLQDFLPLFLGDDDKLRILDFTVKGRRYPESFNQLQKYMQHYPNYDHDMWSWIRISIHWDDRTKKFLKSYGIIDATDCRLLSDWEVTNSYKLVETRFLNSSEVEKFDQFLRAFQFVYKQDRRKYGLRGRYRLPTSSNDEMPQNQQQRIVDYLRNHFDWEIDLDELIPLLTRYATLLRHYEEFCLDPLLGSDSLDAHFPNSGHVGESEIQKDNFDEADNAVIDSLWKGLNTYLKSIISSNLASIKRNLLAQRNISKNQRIIIENIEKVIYLYIVKCKTQKEIADELGISNPSIVSRWIKNKEIPKEILNLTKAKLNEKLVVSFCREDDVLQDWDQWLSIVEAFINRSDVFPLNDGKSPKQRQENADTIYVRVLKEVLEDKISRRENEN